MPRIRAHPRISAHSNLRKLNKRPGAYSKHYGSMNGSITQASKLVKHMTEFLEFIMINMILTSQLLVENILVILLFHLFLLMVALSMSIISSRHQELYKVLHMGCGRLRSYYFPCLWICSPWGITSQHCLVHNMTLWLSINDVSVLKMCIGAQCIYHLSMVMTCSQKNDSNVVWLLKTVDI